MVCLRCFAVMGRLRHGAIRPQTNMVSLQQAHQQVVDLRRFIATILRLRHYMPMVRRRRGGDRGFVISDHADWPGLLSAIKETEAENIYVTHGYTEIFTRYLNEAGWTAAVVSTEYEGDSLETESAA